MVGDPGDLVGRQARIDGVHHAAAAGDAEIELEMAVAVPGQRGHAVAERQAQAVQGIGDLARARGGVGVGVAVHVAFDAARDDLGVAVVARREFDQPEISSGWSCISPSMESPVSFPAVSACRAAPAKRDSPMTARPEPKRTMAAL
jgi:hypothetical protein